MPMTVKKLIAKLQEIENKLLEVEIEDYDMPTVLPGIHSITVAHGKVILRRERKYRNDR